MVRQTLLSNYVKRLRTESADAATSHLSAPAPARQANVGSAWEEGPVGGRPGTKIWSWTFWPRPAHYNPHADTVPTRVDVHLNTEVLNNTSILNNIPYILETRIGWN